MSRKVVVALLIALGLAGGARETHAERAEVVYARGLVAFHAGRYEEALGFFEEAATADPADVYARYYHGLTAGRLGNYAAAVADLRAVVAAQPDFDEAALELGVALVQSGAYRDALPWLERAQAVPRLDGRASFFLGMAHLRLDEMGAARDSFARVAERDPAIEIPARYYQGLTAYRGQHWDEARTQFTNVSAWSPNTDMGRAAAEFLARMRAAPGGRRYRLYGEVGLQYDDNVQLLPGDESIRFIGPSRRADGRLTLLAGATYTVRPSDRIEISTAYEFSQSAHFHLSEFNLQGHRPSLQLAVNVQPVRFGVFGMYEFYLRQTDSFLSQGTVSPWVSVETAWGATEISVRLRRSDFLTQPEKGVLDAWNVAPGVRQYFYVDGPERYVFAGYRFENEDIIHATGEAFAFNAHDFSGGVGWGFPYDIRAQLGYDFLHQWYAAQSDGRRDDQHQVAVGISKPLNRYLMLTLGYFGAFNHSNQAAFRYNRNITSVAIGVSF